MIYLKHKDGMVQLKWDWMSPTCHKRGNKRMLCVDRVRGGHQYSIYMHSKTVKDILRLSCTVHAPLREMPGISVTG